MPTPPPAQGDPATNTDSEYVHITIRGNLGWVADRHFFVYILMNSGGTTLYTGVTNNLIARFRQHNEATTSFVSRYRAVRLVWFEAHGLPTEAIAREKQIKSWRRNRKEALIRTMNPTLRDLGFNLISPAHGH